MMKFSDTIREIEDQLGGLSPVQKILLGTDGSVTGILENITGEPVEVVTILQQVIEADRETASELDIREGEPVNYRIVELRNSKTSETLIYAISYTPLNRLNPEIKTDFMKADIPIGKILKKHRLETRREIIGAKAVGADQDMSNIFNILKDEPLLSREYRIVRDSKPLIRIREVFPYSKFSDERIVIVKAPSRLHLGLIDLNGSLERVDGGIGISINDPGILLEARAGDELKIKCDREDSEAVVRSTAEQIISKTEFPFEASITVRQSPKKHVGLGSGTALSLATACALFSLHGQRLPAEELAAMTGRGGTSGIGTAAFKCGGFLIDGGHSLREEKDGFKPSSASKGVKAPVVTARFDFPEDWKILVAIPNTPQGASGEMEADIFRRHCPVPLNEVREICHEIIMRMLPGIAAGDIELFGSSVNRIQDLGFKKVEKSLQHPDIRKFLYAMNEAGAVCTGMSSFGPALYAIGDTGMNDVKDMVIDMMQSDNGGEAFITTACNKGAEVIER